MINGLNRYRNTIKRILNLVMLWSGSLVVGTGLFLEYRMPGRGAKSLGLTRREWSDVHFYVSLLVIFLVIVHLLLNWDWIKNVGAHAKNWRVIAGLLVALALIGGFFVIPIG
jgi:thiosulfate reductase cytochrome b subunit